MRYLYINEDWPQFIWDAKRLVPYLSATRYKQGRLLGKMQDLGYQLKKEATLAALTEETVKSSAIEGEELNPESVRSSLAHRMGLEAAGARRTHSSVTRRLDAKENRSASVRDLQRCSKPLQGKAAPSQTGCVYTSLGNRRLSASDFRKDQA